ncbi:hypothetical protein TUBRATIS_001770 [Tubulinosema ratisbonensis]|uniref:Peptidase M48 domain-containing protein n=1 Tax=Tubulinosema ratisbonensis TaxID=291195 RepID=A0A437AQ13_9MICR|nr:hypothetical protein TUBRATIS_001770 [Tubulinosema ratisbonensis]
MARKNHLIGIILTSICMAYVAGYLYDFYWLSLVKKDPSKAFDKDVLESIIKNSYKNGFLEYINSVLFNQVKTFQWNITTHLIEILAISCFNLCFFNKKIRSKIFLIAQNIIVKVNDNESVYKNKTNALNLYFILFFSFTLIRLDRMLQNINVIYKSLIATTILFSINFAFQNRKSFKIRYFYLFYMIFAFFILRIVSSNINEENLSSEHKKVPDFLKGESLNVAKKYFKDEIYHITDPNTLNIKTLYSLFNHKLLFKGTRFEDFEEKVILSLIYHEAGHSHPLGFPLVYTGNFLFLILVVFAYLKVFSSLAKNIKEDDLTSETIIVFILGINLPVLLIFSNLFSRLISQCFEVWADYFSVKNCPSENLIEGLVIIDYLNDTPLFTPFIYSLFNCTHPSTFLRTKYINYFVSKFK